VYVVEVLMFDALVKCCGVPGKGRIGGLGEGRGFSLISAARREGFLADSGEKEGVLADGRG